MAKKKEKPKKPANKVYTKYKVEGNDIKRANKTCPKCGGAIFMGSHKDRWSCGKCSYTEMKKKE